MNRVSKVLPSRFGLGVHRFLPIVLLLSVVLSGCGGGAEAEGAEEETEFTRVINVRVTSVERETFTETVRLTGTVQANRDVTISAEESGVVREILVDKGRWVQEGEALFRLDSELLQAQVDQAKALAEMARETWERRKSLYEEDEIGSELMYLEAKFASQQASANLRLLEERLRRTVIRAPIPGILDRRDIEVGTMVGVGTPVARIVNNNPVKITAGVPERYAADIQAGAKAQVTFDVLDDDGYAGTITYTGAAVNARNRTFPLELVLRNPGGIIKPEMVANVAVVRRTFENAIVVPQEAVIRIEDGFVVFVVVDQGAGLVTERRQVELGPAQDNRVLVESGLEAGDRLVVMGQQSVAAGDRVNVVSGG